MIKNLTNATKTALLTVALSSTFILSAFWIQSRAQEKVKSLCSYLDPIAIDIAAFSLGLFLIIEGIYNIALNKKVPPHQQVTRAIRVALGCAIMTLHIMQFIHK